MLAAIREHDHACGALALPGRSTDRNAAQNGSGDGPSMPLYDVGTLEDHLALPLTPRESGRLGAGRIRFPGGRACRDRSLRRDGLRGGPPTREIGIRVAIGATKKQCTVARDGRATINPGDRRNVLRNGGRARHRQILQGGSLWNQPARPETYAVAIGVMAVVALIACTIPAQRALAVDPARALREDKIRLMPTAPSSRGSAKLSRQSEPRPKEAD